MKYINLRTVGWLISTTIIYLAYYLFDFNQKIAEPIIESNLINNFWLQYNPLLWLYLASIVSVLIMGIISKKREDSIQAQINKRKRKKQRRNYSI